MLKTRFSRKQFIEAGIVLAILFLIIQFYSKNNFWLGISIAILFINLLLPVIFYPFALIWFNLSETLGIVMSRLVLGIIFFLIVLPVGVVRNLSGKDNLLLNKFKHDNSSVMKTRNYTYKSEDLNKPF